MNTSGWEPFLEQWSRTILASPEVEHFGLPPEVIQSGWLGYPGATEAQIAAAEKRLNVQLPPSYRSFLQVTNGWRCTGLGIDRLLPVEEINWFGTLHPGWIEAWMDGFADCGRQDYTYNPEFDEVDYRHMPKTLVISEAGDLEILLLNPQAVAADGEWEAWSFVDDGAGRHQTFWHLLQSKHDILKQVSQTLGRRPRSSEPVEAVVDKLPGLIVALEEKQGLVHSLAANDKMGMYQAQVKGLGIAIERVRKLQGITDPDELRKRLLSLAEELTAEAGQMEAPMKKLAYEAADIALDSEPNLTAMLLKLGPMMKGIHTGGEAMGKRAGADTIRWYLGER